MKKKVFEYNNVRHTGTHCITTNLTISIPKRWWWPFSREFWKQGFYFNHAEYVEERDK